MLMRSVYLAQTTPRPGDIRNQNISNHAHTSFCAVSKIKNFLSALSVLSATIRAACMLFLRFLRNFCKHVYINYQTIVADSYINLSASFAKVERLFI